MPGRVAIATGAAGDGMGRSIALTLAREGASVVVNYRASEESAHAIMAHIQRRGGAAIAVQADVFEADGCRKLVGAALERFHICFTSNGSGATRLVQGQTMKPNAVAQTTEMPICTNLRSSAPICGQWGSSQ